MKKILILFICIFCFAKAGSMGEQHDNLVVDRETQGEIDKEVDEVGPRDSYICDIETANENSECDIHFNNIGQTWLDRTTDNLDNLLTEWENTTKELNKNAIQASELVLQQEIALGLQEKKILKLKEISFNLQKAIDLNIAQIELLQTKKRLNDKMLSK